MKLASYTAPSGSESELQHVLLDHVENVADEVTVDALGNAIAKKHGKGPHVVIAAHADEIGVMVIHIGDDGFLRLISIGDVQASRLIGRHIKFTNGVLGVVGVESKVKLQDVAFDHLYVDIGCATKADAEKKISIGIAGVVAEEVVALDEHKLAGRALDNRVGCAIAIEAFRQVASEGFNVSVVFTAQQTVGARGAKTAAFRLEPDLALIVDAAPAGDMPKADRMELKLGAGPAVKIMDGTAIVPLQVKDQLIAAAETAGVAIQYEVWPRGLSDAGSFQLTVDGIHVGGISYPARYVGGPSTVIDLRDAEGAVRLLVQAVRGQSI